MSIGKSNQAAGNFLRAVALFALCLTVFGVGCNLQPGPPNDTLPSPLIQQSLSPSPPPSFPSPTASSAVSGEHPSPTASAANYQAKSTPKPAPLPSPTEELRTPFVPIVGNADKIAFINQTQIWMANLDGTSLTQLTNDELPKSSLQWSPDNQGVIYLAGVCANYIDIHTQQVRSLACFDQANRLESFQVSPDGDQVAISLDGQLYVVPYDEDGFSQIRSIDTLIERAECQSLAPYKHRGSLVTVSKARWSADGDRLAILRQAYDADRHVELIQIIDITRCEIPLPRLDEFPATRFDMEDYALNPIIQDFAWNGDELFALTSYQRNDGFGDLWVYNTDLHRGFKANPIDGECCYRDPVFSPDGKYLAFAYQDTRLAPNGAAVLYYVPYAALDSSLVYPPLPLPTEFFSERRSKPQPILRPAR